MSKFLILLILLISFCILNNSIEANADSVDTTPPTVSITSPINGTTFYAPSITINGTSFDSGSGINNIQGKLEWNGTFSPANGTDNWSFTLHGLSDGFHTFLAKATDNAGNISTVAASFHIDTKVPEFPFALLILAISMMSLLIIYRIKLK